MDSNDLTHEQTDALTTSLRRRLAYLVKLKTRMERQRFPVHDPLYVATVAAYNAVHELTVKSHYLSCRGQVGR